MWQYNMLADPTSLMINLRSANYDWVNFHGEFHQSPWVREDLAELHDGGKALWVWNITSGVICPIPSITVPFLTRNVAGLWTIHHGIFNLKTEYHHGAPAGAAGGFDSGLMTNYALACVLWKDGRGRIFCAEPKTIIRV